MGRPLLIGNLEGDRLARFNYKQVNGTVHVPLGLGESGDICLQISKADVQKLGQLISELILSLVDDL